MSTTDHQYFLRGVPATYIPKLWDHVEAFIKRALDRAAGEIVADDAKQFCLERKMQLWVITDGKRAIGAGTTEIINYRRKKTCRIVTLAGKNFAEWSHRALEQLTEWAQSQGCDDVEVLVRPGFAKKLVQHGFSKKYDILIRKIGEKDG